MIRLSLLAGLALMLGCATPDSPSPAAESAPAAAADAPLIRSAAAPGAMATITNLQDGDEVSSPVLVQFGLQGMGVAPAGIQMEHTGHHHLLIDTDPATLNMADPLPASETVVHFGKGQTETIIELAPGQHTLQLMLGNYAHIPHDPPVVSERITITVE